MEAGGEPRVDNQVAIGPVTDNEIADHSVDLVLVLVTRYGAEWLEERGKLLHSARFLGRQSQFGQIERKTVPPQARSAGVFASGSSEPQE